MPRIYGDRLMLREFQKEDLKYMREWVNDYDTVKTLDDVFLYPHTLNMTEDFLNSILENKILGSKHFVIADVNTGEYIGQTGLINIDWRNQSAELGIIIGRKENRNKGYGRETILLLLQFAFKQMNLHRVELKLQDRNLAGYNCYLKCGFKEEGRKRKSLYMDGDYMDIIYMAILKDEFYTSN